MRDATEASYAASETLTVPDVDNVADPADVQTPDLASAGEDDQPETGAGGFADTDIAGVAAPGDDDQDDATAGGGLVDRDEPPQPAQD